jgi:pimeloyl-ACP methyl ester carboxylesterase
MPHPRLHRTVATVRVALIVVALLTAALALVEALRIRADARAHTPPGALVTVDGTADHLHCVGAGGPTTVLIGGMGGDAYGWTWVQRRLAEHQRVCAYDRPGYGYSTYRPAEADPTLGAVRLAEVLAAAGEAGPFVVAGHSLGGHYARAFAAAFPDETAALVLVDARPPEIIAAMPEQEEGLRRMQTMLHWGLRLAPFGAARAYAAATDPTAPLPSDVQGAARARLARPDHVRRLADEVAQLAALDAHTAASIHPDVVPVLAVVAGSPAAGFADEDWATLHPLIRESSRLVPSATVHVVPDAEHVTLLTHEDHATELADAIAAVAAAVPAPTMGRTGH